MFDYMTLKRRAWCIDLHRQGNLNIIMLILYWHCLRRRSYLLFGWPHIHWIGFALAYFTFFFKKKSSLFLDALLLWSTTFSLQVINTDRPAMLPLPTIQHYWILLKLPIWPFLTFYLIEGLNNWTIAAGIKKYHWYILLGNVISF